MSSLEKLPSNRKEQGLIYVTSTLQEVWEIYFQRKTALFA